MNFEIIEYGLFAPVEDDMPVLSDGPFTSLIANTTAEFTFAGPRDFGEIDMAVFYTPEAISTLIGRYQVQIIAVGSDFATRGSLVFVPAVAPAALCDELNTLYKNVPGVAL